MVSPQMELESDLATALRQRPMLADGAMGTQLQRAGLEPGGCGELWNIAQPARVQAIHRAYAGAGAQLIITNTFGANRFALDRHGAAEHVVAINRAGAEIARRAVGERAWVLGDIGPFGGFIAPLGEHAEGDVYAAFLEQARALVEGGVDGIIVETMSAIEEITLAIRAARESGARIVFASMAFEATRVGPRTMMGTAPEPAATAMLSAGADVIGSNCGTSLAVADHAEIIRHMRTVAPSAMLISQPNAGQPVRHDDGEIVYPGSAELMASEIVALLDAGASIVGGCCGTTPEHIAAFANCFALYRSG